jgi:hypothetical protein
VLAVPDEKDHRAKFADWLELKAIASADARVGFGTLVSAAVLTENDQDEDIADQDAEEDRLVQAAQEEIERRITSIGAGYPFRIDPKGNALSFVTPLTSVGVVYLFCLYLTQVADHTIIKKTDAPKVDNKVRDLFQACSTVAAGGYVRGPAISFGWPRPNGTNFLKALKAVYKEFGDGKPHKTARPGAAKAIKDNGIDVIAWRRQADKLPGTHYLIGQVASGSNWTVKSVTANRRHFHKFWFERAPGSQATDAMFIPFNLEPDLPDDSTPYQEVLNDFVAGLNYEFGDVFYRDRIARNFADGMTIVEAGETYLQRHKDLPKITRWVNNYSKRLQTA